MTVRLLGLLCLLFASTLSADEQVLSFHSDITIQRNGDLHVIENIHVRAENRHINRGIYRDFPTIYKDNIGRVTRVGFNVLSVKRDGMPEPFHLKKMSNGQRVYMGDRNVQLTPGEYIYELEYTTTRQLGFFENHDELYWNVTGNGWSFPILKASATVQLPEAVSDYQVELSGYTGAQGSTEQNLIHRIDQNGHFYFETTQALASRQGLTIVASWPKAIIQQPSDELKQQYFIQDNKHHLIAVGGFILVLGYYLLLWLKVGKDPEKGVIMPRYQAPKGFSPASTRFIYKMNYDKNCFTTALVNLALKGAISIDQSESSLFKKGVFTITKLNNPGVELAAGEEVILNELFSSSNSIDLTQSEHKRIGKAVSEHQASLRDDYEKLYFLTNKKYFFPGIVITLASLIYAITNIPDEQATFATIFVSLMTLIPFFVIGLTYKRLSKKRNKGLSFLSLAIQTAFFGFFMYSAADIVSQLLSQLSDVAWPIVFSAYAMIATNILFEQWLKAPTLAGRKLLDKIEGFKLYLNVAEKDEIELQGEPKFTTDIYEKFLPFAIALGVDHAWSKKLESAIATGLVDRGFHPRGFVYFNANDSISTFSSSLSDNLNSAVSSSSTAPGSSSGSSGGGSSGGGGGGGGGGGW